jgi:VanZ family protein
MAARELGARMLRAAPAWWALLALLVVVVGWLALTPQPPPEFDTGWDKLNHQLAFSALAFCAIHAGRGGRRAIAFAWLALLAYGGAIELVQLHVPGRQAEFADLLADAVGIALGVLAALALRRAVGLGTRPQDAPSAPHRPPG